MTPWRPFQRDRDADPGADTVGPESVGPDNVGQDQAGLDEARQQREPSDGVVTQPEIGPQTAQINLNLRNPVQANVYGSEESRQAFHDLENLLLGSERDMTRREAAHSGGLSLLNARKIWRAMGFPNLTDEEVYFTARDAEALRDISELVLNDEVTEEGALSLVRSMAQMTDRMVVWQVEALVEDLVVNGERTDAQARRELLNLLPRLMPTLEKLLIYSWRRQLNAAVQRLAMRQERPDGSTMSGLRDADDDDDSTDLPLARGIGFADMVSYTSLSRQMNERTLAALVQRFEQRCAEVIAVGRGRLIKTIGDEVMFMAESPEEGALMALALARIIRDDPELPQSRVAFVWGRVLPRLGDLYGPTVNLASRLVALTPPGSVLVDASTASVLRGDDRFVLTPKQTHNVRGFGDVQPVELLEGPGQQLEVDYA
ncbi:MULTISPECIES: adenylate/guanylate cyclase domain-containing protein [Kocuria]|uniref:Adenylate/guanylate cyclase domain-containing protein n=1 Tax=Kocuria subflava TaxID=1736139 RepID=A0A846TW21_9MICC|nr:MULTISPECIES: adenylate/guanylate cyclase domain-containing protein [Kocuria]NKE09962.1 adenylate/guanylate cyclase domain-containing protein [Kocuria subflava]